VVTVAEIRRGVDRLDPGAKRRRIDLWLRQDVTERFQQRLLPVDVAIVEAWGRLLAKSQAAGRSVPTLDAFIAATAERHDLTLVTRHVKDFESLSIRLLNPWSELLA
jgi:predicted nucleic acid-binding protein